MSTISDKIFEITNTKLYIPIVNSSTKDNLNLIKLLVERFKSPVYLNESQAKIATRDLTITILQDFLLMLFLSS